ncbi:MAG: hypothetical protein U1G07_26835 [Verrucomicrobiota bacterium]
MESIKVHLHQAIDAEDSFALSLGDDHPPPWWAERGFGRNFQMIWSVELESDSRPDVQQVDWDLVLQRVVEAYDLNDPVITDFVWPLRQTAGSDRAGSSG